MWDFWIHPQHFTNVTTNVGSIISVIMLDIKSIRRVITSLSPNKIQHYDKSLLDSDSVPFLEIRGSTSVSRDGVNLSCSHSPSHSVLYLSALWYIYNKIIIWHDRVPCAFLKCAWISISRFAAKNNNPFPSHLFFRPGQSTDDVVHPPSVLFLLKSCLIIQVSVKSCICGFLSLWNHY